MPMGPGPIGGHTWAPTQNGSLHKMGPCTKCVPTQNGSLHKISP